MIENNLNNNELPTRSQAIQNANGVGAERPNSRRESVSSQISSSTTSPHYDSGNISDLNLNFCPASPSSADDDSIISSDSLQQQNKIHFLLRERDQSLFLALQDVRKLKSELERLSKSEKWYKSELKLQRNSKLEVLEKLYTNERKFTQDNQNLQNERIALYARCGELETQLQSEKDSAMKLLKNNNSRPMVLTDEVDSKDFELEQHRQRLADQNQLVDILRNQKRSLLNDLQKLGCEKDVIVVQLQKNIAQLEDENRTITKRCLQLVESKIALTDEISGKEADWRSTSNEVLDLQIVVRKLQDKLHSHIAELNHKDQELASLKYELSQTQDANSDLLIKHQKELLDKEQSILKLTETIDSLKIEICNLQDLHQRYNDQQFEIEKLQSKLQEQMSQIEKFKNLEEQKSTPDDEVLEENQKQITLVTNNAPIIGNEEIKQILKQNKKLQNELDSIKSSQSLEHNSLRKTQTELQQVSEKYQNVCKLYETTKFDLDMRDITIEKLRFEKEKDTREIKLLREKLIDQSNQLDCQRILGTEFEFLLSKTQQEMNRLKAENQCNIDKIVKFKVETNQSAERLNEKDSQIEELKAELLAARELNAKLISINSSKVLKEKETSQSRVDLLQKLMSLQAGKVEQLNAEQQEWENLLTTLDSSNNDHVPCSEFDDLNQLFDEQNVELDELNQNYHKQSENFKKALDLSQRENQLIKEQLKSASLNINDLESRIQAMECANADYQKEIAHLAGTNERLIQEFNKDFTQERQSHKKQIKQFQLEAKLRDVESDMLREKMQAELDELKLSQKSSQETLNREQHDQQQRSEQDRILQNVLESEHQRKMFRYDLHIRSLLSNVKSYKKNLEIVENRYEALITKSKDMVEVEQLRAMECALQDMRTQFENSQTEINNLKHQLKTMNEQFYATDACKSSSAMDMTNLMDDYKKLIQQSQIKTKQPSTSEIYKLINKSNSFVPKLTNISTSVNKLREDIQQICTVINVSSSGRAGSPQLKMSLMDELKLADNKN